MRKLLSLLLVTVGACVPGGHKCCGATLPQVTLSLPQSTLGTACPVVGSGCKCGCEQGRPCTCARAELPEVWVFTATWCEPCKAYKASVLESARVKAAARIVYVDVDKEREKVRKYAVGTIPMTIRPDGGRLTGIVDETGLIAWIKSGAK